MTDTRAWFVTPDWSTAHTLRHGVHPARTSCGRSLVTRPHWPESTTTDQPRPRCGQCERRIGEET